MDFSTSIDYFIYHVLSFLFRVLPCQGWYLCYCFLLQTVARIRYLYMGFLQTNFGLVDFRVWNSLFIDSHDFLLLFRRDDPVYFKKSIPDISSRNMNIHLFFHSDKSVCFILQIWSRNTCYDKSFFFLNLKSPKGQNISSLAEDNFTKTCHLEFIFTTDLDLKDCAYLHFWSLVPFNH